MKSLVQRLSPRGKGQSSKSLSGGAIAAFHASSPTAADDSEVGDVELLADRVVVVQKGADTTSMKEILFAEVCLSE